VIAKAPHRVLSNLNEDGTRFRIEPRTSRGRFWRRRGVVAYALIALFVALPFVRIGGRPAFLIDLASRRVLLLGAVFRPSDGASLMLLGLAIALTVFLVTTLWGRVWCGWGCPQTVYLEWVFRPIERLIEGRTGRGPARRAIKYAVFGVLSVAVANVFLAYFVPVGRLAHWMSSSPALHPAGFLVVVGVSALMFFDFAYFREYTCTVACPYGRLQTVLLDRQSLIVGYDAARGEPRGKVAARRALPVVGDCIDCRACVTTCPTGIDIREGLQMECVGCAQCIDACDAIMDRVHRPRGLIRYASQDELAGKPRRLLRARTFAYPALLAVVIGLLAWQLRAKPAAEVWVLRVEGAPFADLGDGRVSSQLQLRIENRGGAAHRYTVSVLDAPDVELMTPRGPVEVAAGASARVVVVAVEPGTAFHGGERAVTMRIEDEAGWRKDVAVTLLGPEGSAP
jgi:cytochrome c oxidase accessory protein FixG